METKKKPVVSVPIHIRKNGKLPVGKQITRELIRLRSRGALKPGDRLPGIRSLASDLGVAPNTVAGAYAELAATGFAVSKPASGYFVAETKPIPEPPRPARPSVHGRPLTRKAEAARSAAAAAGSGNFENRPFKIYGSAMEKMVERDWVKIAASTARSPWRHTFYSPPAGYAPLRKVIAAKLRETRGIVCGEENIVITTGSVQSLSLIAGTLFTPGDAILTEAPMLPLDAKVLDFAGLRRIPVPVDREGMVFTAPEGVLKPKGILVTPASQMPMSVPMADARRAAILRLALDTGAWILEEDTDGVVTLGAKPRFPIRSLPRADEAVIYMESFTLQVFPGLRLAYAVLPEPQAEALAGAKLLTDRFTSESLQAALAEYLESPGSAHHIRKMARDYRKRFSRSSGMLFARHSDLLAGCQKLKPALTSRSFLIPLSLIPHCRPRLSVTGSPQERSAVSRTLLPERMGSFSDLERLRKERSSQVPPVSRNARRRFSPRPIPADTVPLSQSQKKPADQKHD